MSALRNYISVSMPILPRQSCNSKPILFTHRPKHRRSLSTLRHKQPNAHKRDRPISKSADLMWRRMRRKTKAQDSSPIWESVLV